MGKSDLVWAADAPNKLKRAFLPTSLFQGQGRHDSEFSATFLSVGSSTLLVCCWVLVIILLCASRVPFFLGWLRPRSPGRLSCGHLKHVHLFSIYFETVEFHVLTPQDGLTYLAIEPNSTQPAGSPRYLAFIAGATTRRGGLS